MFVYEDVQLGRPLDFYGAMDPRRRRQVGWHSAGDADEHILCTTGVVVDL